MNSTTMLITIIILIALYPFILYYQLKTLKIKMDKRWNQIEKLLKEEADESSQQIIEEIHIARRSYNKLVRENNHKLCSSLAQFIAKKHAFTQRDFFEFQGR